MGAEGFAFRAHVPKKMGTIREVHSITLLPEHNKETARGPPVGLKQRKGYLRIFPAPIVFKSHTV